MPEERYPGAVQHPGQNDGTGPNRLEVVKCHYTVGVNSLGTLGRDFQFLISRDGTVHQGAGVSSVCWDSSEWNDAGPGIEIEYHPDYDGDRIFTDAARDACSGLIHWLSWEWGFPLDYYDGDRLAEGHWRGFISHRSLQQTDGHSDWWPREDWDRMVAGAQPAPPSEEDRMQPEFMASKAGVIYVYDPNSHTKTRVNDPEIFDAIASYWKINGVNADVSSNDTTEVILRGAVEIA